MGPLVLQAGDAQLSRSLFARSTKAVSRDATVAFRTLSEDVLNFCEGLDDFSLTDKSGGPVTKADVVDHAASWSIYFADPDQNWLEVTTYDHDLVAGQLDKVS